MPEPSEQYPISPPDESPPDDQARCTAAAPDNRMVLVSEEEGSPVAVWKYWKDAIAQWPEYDDNAAALSAGAPLGTPYRTPTGSLRIVVVVSE